MAKVTAVSYNRGKAKVYFSDGTQSPKIEANDVNDWIASVKYDAKRN